MNRKVSLILISIVLMQACGGRQVRPLEEVSSLDPHLTCSHIAGEYEVNLSRAEELIGEQGQKGGANVAMVIFLGLAAFPFIDISGAEKAEIVAIIKRNERLDNLAKENNCPPLATPTQ